MFKKNVISLYHNFKAMKDPNILNLPVKQGEKNKNHETGRTNVTHFNPSAPKEVNQGRGR